MRRAVLFAPGFLLLLLIPPARAADPAPEAKKHWSFIPPRRPEVPAPKSADWCRNPIDNFLLKDLEEAGLVPAEEASRITLIRRVRFDLTGQPPSPEEIDAFVLDTRPDAYERLVDRLLASPEYGERMARSWLDLARYSESDGFKSDKTRPNAWRYRDWVVKALNDDMPYSRFLSLQIAGDELEPTSAEAFIATGFNRNYPEEDNNKVPGLNRQLMLDDVTDTTASVALALTIGCARCHDHKFDPISQKDYYRVQALFAGLEAKDDRPLADAFGAALHRFVAQVHDEKLAALKKELESVERPYRLRLLKEQLAKLPADLRKALETKPEERSAFQEDLLAKNASKMKVDAKVMKAAMPESDRKRWDSTNAAMQKLTKQAPPPLPSASGMTEHGAKPPEVFLLRKGTFGQPVEPVDPGFPSIFSAAFEPKDSVSGTTGRRAALAEWLTSPSNPLTARVMVNRLWQHHFGRGIVATPSDFGTQGAEPSSPALLDWLACEFLARGWSMKAMHRLMVTSAAYRQSSMAPKATLDLDPENSYFGRMPRKRLEGEAVRDAILTVSGQLNPKVGGPSVFPDLPPGVETRGGWSRSERAEDRNRKSLYVFARRNLKYPLFDAFDAPDPNVTCPERNVSVNAPQALMLLNSDLVASSARGFADRVRREAKSEDPELLITRAYRLALGRAPDSVETDRAIIFLKDGGTLADFCHAVLNLNEFVFVD